MSGPAGHSTPIASYPSAVATDAELGIQTNNTVTRLAQPMTATDLTFEVSDATTTMPTTGFVTIDNERIRYTSKNDATRIFTIASLSDRGIDGTTASSHSYHSYVYFNIIAYHHNRLAKEIQAIETQLGVGFDSTGIAHVDESQTFTGQPTFNAGIAIGSDVQLTRGAANQLDIGSDDGLKFSNMTTATRDANFGATPATSGIVIYNTTVGKLQVSASGVWVDLH